MKYIILGKNIEVTDGLRAAVEDKIGKLEKYFTPETEVHVTLSVEKDRHKIEVTGVPKEVSEDVAKRAYDDCLVKSNLSKELVFEPLGE